GANGQEGVSAANDGLISVVSVEVQPAPCEDARENVARGGDALSILAANSDREIYRRHLPLLWLRRLDQPKNPTGLSSRLFGVLRESLQNFGTSKLKLVGCSE